MLRIGDHIEQAVASSRNRDEETVWPLRDILLTARPLFLAFGLSRYERQFLTIRFMPSK